MTRAAAVIAALLLTCAIARPVSAQARFDESADAQARRAPAPRRSGHPLHVRGFFLADSERMTASRTFDGEFGTSTFTGYGGGGEWDDIWRHIFVRGAASQAKRTGTRGFVLDDKFFSLGVPLRTSIRTVEVSAGLRRSIGRRAMFSVYGGAGLVRVGLKERSDFADASENTDESFTGAAVFGGFDARVTRWIFAGVEAQYRRVSNALGTGGVSQGFGEASLGGAAVRVLVGIRR